MRVTVKKGLDKSKTNCISDWFSAGARYETKAKSRKFSKTHIQETHIDKKSTSLDVKCSG